MIEPARAAWPDLTLVETAAACHGCGTLPVARSHIATDVPELSEPLRHEAASPRSQANLVHACWPAAEIDPRLWGAETNSGVPHADLCIHCKLCRSECPSGVDVSSLMFEAKAAHVEISTAWRASAGSGSSADRRLWSAAGEPVSHRDQLPPGAP